jgi:hypothetical protein
MKNYFKFMQEGTNVSVSPKARSSMSFSSSVGSSNLLYCSMSYHKIQKLAPQILAQENVGLNTYSQIYTITIT